MEFIIEVLLELVLEGSIELSKSVKVPKWIRYILITFISLFFLSAFLLMFYISASCMKENVLLGIIILVITLVFFILAIRQFIKVYMTKYK